MPLRFHVRSARLKFRRCRARFVSSSVCACRARAPWLKCWSSTTSSGQRKTEKRSARNARQRVEEHGQPLVGRRHVALNGDERLAVRQDVVAERQGRVCRTDAAGGAKLKTGTVDNRHGVPGPISGNERQLTPAG